MQAIHHRPDQDDQTGSEAGYPAGSRSVLPANVVFLYTLNPIHLLLSIFF